MEKKTSSAFVEELGTMSKSKEEYINEEATKRKNKMYSIIPKLVELLLNEIKKEIKDLASKGEYDQNGEGKTIKYACYLDRVIDKIHDYYEIVTAKTLLKNLFDYNIERVKVGSFLKIPIKETVFSIKKTEYGIEFFKQLKAVATKDNIAIDYCSIPSQNLRVNGVYYEHRCWRNNKHYPYAAAFPVDEVEYYIPIKKTYISSDEGYIYSYNGDCLEKISKEYGTKYYNSYGIFYSITY